LLSSSVTAWTVTSEKRHLHRILNRLHENDEHIIYNPQALLFSRLYIPHLPFFLTRAGTTLSSF
ncbi:hypothetical protein QU848_01995, partial [Escherichia coli]|nr:hypothetical protein [Escherichia coli]